MGRWETKRSVPARIVVCDVIVIATTCDAATLNITYTCTHWC